MTRERWHQATVVYWNVLEGEVCEVNLEHVLLQDPAPHGLTAKGVEEVVHDEAAVVHAPRHEGLVVPMFLDVLRMIVVEDDVVSDVSLELTGR